MKRVIEAQKKGKRGKIDSTTELSQNKMKNVSWLLMERRENKFKSLLCWLQQVGSSSSGGSSFLCGVLDDCV